MTVPRYRPGQRLLHDGQVVRVLAVSRWPDAVGCFWYGVDDGVRATSVPEMALHLPDGPKRSRPPRRASA